MNKAIYLMGVYKVVLDEILNSQQENPGSINYLQPYSSKPIRLLAAYSPLMAGLHRGVVALGVNKRLAVSATPGWLAMQLYNYAKRHPL